MSCNPSFELGPEVYGIHDFCGRGIYDGKYLPRDHRPHHHCTAEGFQTIFQIQIQMQKTITNTNTNEMQIPPKRPPDHTTAEGFKLQGVQKKCPIATFSLHLFQRSDYTFSHVFRNQNFEPVRSKPFKHTYSEY